MLYANVRSALINATRRVLRLNADKAILLNICVICQRVSEVTHVESRRGENYCEAHELQSTEALKTKREARHRRRLCCCCTCRLGAYVYGVIFAVAFAFAIVAAFAFA